LCALWTCWEGVIHLDAVNGWSLLLLRPGLCPRTLKKMQSKYSRGVDA